MEFFDQNYGLTALEKYYFLWRQKRPLCET